VATSFLHTISPAGFGVAAVAGASATAVWVDGTTTCGAGAGVWSDTMTNARADKAEANDMRGLAIIRELNNPNDARSLVPIKRRNQTLSDTLIAARHPALMTALSNR
jgi:hypothetical protein